MAKLEGAWAEGQARISGAGVGSWTDGARPDFQVAAAGPCNAFTLRFPDDGEFVGALSSDGQRLCLADKAAGTDVGCWVRDAPPSPAPPP